jgi:hypothetical protein
MEKGLLEKETLVELRKTLPATNGASGANAIRTRFLHWTLFEPNEFIPHSRAVIIQTQF